MGKKRRGSRDVDISKNRETYIQTGRQKTKGKKSNQENQGYHQKTWEQLDRTQPGAPSTLENEQLFFKEKEKKKRKERDERYFCNRKIAFIQE